ncbi:hypothetical protein GYMLUDRAFT_101174 [Collybiopsis luxurians FD-317 M1]|uniref:Uncharacterized protein n=1 Tax=Collybiopsis luxurians FD-317 M1 TaxID=944289 RepID=A0A0D0BNJ7_9AGAR|nr:hypothetical protein GYMLUDRAFT_101174 [Collybiopsis luxurians FD-317 M1]
MGKFVFWSNSQQKGEKPIQKLKDLQMPFPEVGRQGEGEKPIQKLKDVQVTTAEIGQQKEREKPVQKLKDVQPSTPNIGNGLHKEGDKPIQTLNDLQMPTPEVGQWQKEGDKPIQKLKGLQRPTPNMGQRKEGDKTIQKLKDVRAPSPRFGQQKEEQKPIQKLQHLRTPTLSQKLFGELLHTAHDVGFAKGLIRPLSWGNRERQKLHVRSRIGNDPKLLISNLAESSSQEETHYVMKLGNLRELVEPLSLTVGAKLKDRKEEGITANVEANCEVFASYVVRENVTGGKIEHKYVPGDLRFEFELGSPKDGVFTQLEFCVELYHDSDTKDKSIKIWEWDPKRPKSLQATETTQSKSTEGGMTVAASYTSPLSASIKHNRSTQLKSNTSSIQVHDRIRKHMAKWTLSPKDGALLERLDFLISINNLEFPLPLTAKVSLKINIDNHSSNLRTIRRSFLGKRKFSELDDQRLRVLEIPMTTIRFVPEKIHTSSVMNLPGTVDFISDTKPSIEEAPMLDPDTDGQNWALLLFLCLLFLFVLQLRM